MKEPKPWEVARNSDIVVKDASGRVLRVESRFAPPPSSSSTLEPIGKRKRSMSNGFAEGVHPRSRAERRLAEILDKYLPKGTQVLYGWRTSALNSPRGFPMHLDAYIPSMQLALEVQGRQHEEILSGMTEDDLQRQVQRDKRKLARCKKMGVQLVRLSAHKLMGKGAERLVTDWLKSAWSRQSARAGWTYARYPMPNHPAPVAPPPGD